MSEEDFCRLFSFCKYTVNIRNSLLGQEPVKVVWT